MGNILVIGDPETSRRWESVLLSRLEGLGHTVSVRHAERPGPGRRMLDYVLAVEQCCFGHSLALRRRTPLAPASHARPDLVIDLTGTAGGQEKPVLTLEIFGSGDVMAGIAAALTGRQLPEFVTRLDGVAVGRARPVVSDGLRISRALDDMLAGAISLVVQGVVRFFAGRLEPVGDLQAPARPEPALLRSYLPFVAGTLAKRILRRRPVYWQVAYRLVDGPGVAETHRLDGPAYTVLADDGRRFYADPFPFERDGRHYLFVEEFPYRSGRGVVSVATLGADGRFGVPQTVIEEPHHLSYPQVFADGGEVFMIPESSAAREVVLYRAERFPDRWQRDRTLIAGRDLNDMTLLFHGGRYWLIGTERYGCGSPSDTMVVYVAPTLRGPWTPHPLNPITIDRAGARPGGAFIRRGGRIFLPVQDGSNAYGDGLGLMELTRLDEETVLFAPPAAIGAGSAWANPAIHTLNRAGRLEVIDSAG